MRDYAKVSPAFWIKGSGKRLRGDRNAQLVALYLMTCASANMIGLYYLPMPIACHEMGLSEEELRQGLARVREEGIAIYDFAAEYVFVPQMATYQIGESLAVKDNRRVAVLKTIEQIDHPNFVDLFFERYGSAYKLDTPIYPKGASHERFPKRTIDSLWERDKATCQHCGMEGSRRGPGGVPEGSKGLHIDHRVAKINGGGSSLDNLQLLCPSCNATKAAIDRKLFWDNILDCSEDTDPETPPGGVPEGSRRGPIVVGEPGSGSGSGSEAGSGDPPYPPGGSGTLPKKLPEGVARFEGNGWAEAYVETVRSVAGISDWIFPGKQTVALREVIESACPVECRTDICDWIRREVRDFIESVTEIEGDNAARFFSGFDPNGLRGWINKSRPGFDRPSSVVPIAPPAKTELHRPSAEEVEARRDQALALGAAAERKRLEAQENSTALRAGVGK